jgi:hypothetical protein
LPTTGWMRQEIISAPTTAGMTHHRPRGCLKSPAPHHPAFCPWAGQKAGPRPAIGDKSRAPQRSIRPGCAPHKALVNGARPKGRRPANLAPTPCKTRSPTFAAELFSAKIAIWRAHDVNNAITKVGASTPTADGVASAMQMTGPWADERAWQKTRPTCRNFNKVRVRLSSF